MNCLTRIEIQEYIDEELSSNFRDDISDHLVSCEGCRQAVDQALRDKELVSSFMSLLPEPAINAKIPSFKKPAGKARRILILAAEFAVAASVTVFILFTYKDRGNAFEIPEAEMLMREFYEGQDLNRMWHEKSQLFIYQTDEGEVILSF